MRASSILLSVLLLGCSTDPGVTQPSITVEPDGLVDSGVPYVEPGTEHYARFAEPITVSGEMIFDRSGVHAFALDLDRRSIVVIERAYGAERGEVVLGLEPTRMVRRERDVWVTVRGTGEVVHLHDDDGGLTEVSRAHVGAEPYDVVASAHSDAIYVSLSQEDAVVELDPTTLVEVRRWEVDGEPRWLIATPAELQERVWVASSSKPMLSGIDPQSGVSDSVDLPTMARFTDPLCDQRDLARRITGEIALSSDGRAIYLPMLYADTLLQVPDPVDPTAPAIPDAGCSQAAQPITGRAATQKYYSTESLGASDPANTGRFEPAVLKFALDAELEHEAIHLGSVITANEGSFDGVARGYPKGLVVQTRPGEDNDLLYVTMESLRTLLRVDLGKPTHEPTAPGFATYARSTVRTLPGPISPRVSPGDDRYLWVYSWLGRTLEVHDKSAMVATGPRGTAIFRSTRVEGHELAPSTSLNEQQILGRRLFYAGDNRPFTSLNGGTACANCHLEGRTDGLTWQLVDFDRQTPSLAGTIAFTEPVTWTGDVATAVEEILLTSSIRMGGTGPTQEQAEAVASYLYTLRAPVRPDAVDDEHEARIALGEQLFDSPAVGCVTCHQGSLGMDNQQHDLFGLEGVDTPALKGVGATAPYLHNGSASTIRDVLERSRDGSMGNTGGLSETEMDALEAFLLSW